MTCRSVSRTRRLEAMRRRTVLDCGHSLHVYTCIMTTDCYCTSLRAATRRLSALYDEALEPVGVNVAQWGLLRKLGAADSQPLSIGELAEASELERSTVARNVRVLEKLGLVRL